VRITERILHATRLNAQAVEQPKGLRLGYMGHLTLLTSHLLSFLIAHPDLNTKLESFLHDEAWQEHVAKTHREVVEVCEKPLGGPVQGDVVDTRTDQLARFMIQQVMGHLPDKFASHEEDEDDELTWAYVLGYDSVMLVNLNARRKHPPCEPIA
jgi:hypothetical protein